MSQQRYIKPFKADDAVMLLSLIVVELTCVFTLFSVTDSLLRIECLALGAGLMVLNLGERRFKMVVPVMLWCAWTVFLLVISGRFSERGFNAPLGNVLKYIYLFLACVIAVFLQTVNHKQRTLVIVSALLTMLVTGVISCSYALFIDREAIRYAGYLYSYVASFDQVYLAPVLACSLLSVALDRRCAGSRRLLLFACYLFFCWFLFLSSLTTAFLLVILGSAVVFILRMQTERWKFVLLIVIATVLIGMVYIFRNEIADWLYQLTEPLERTFRMRIRYVVDKVLGTVHENESYDREGRSMLMGFSWNTFLEHPLLGVAYFTYGYGVIGAHAEWVDMLGVFGLVGSAVLLGVIGWFALYVYRGIEDELDRRSYIAALFLYVVLGFLNPCMSLQVLLGTFVIAPNISCLMKKARPKEPVHNSKYIRKG